MSFALQITYVDVENECFVFLGGAAWLTRCKQRAAFESVPAVADSNFVLDLRDGNPGYSIEDDKCISEAMVERLLGEPVAVLIERARASEVPA